MKKFIFKFQKLLELRERLEKDQKNILAQAAAQYQELAFKKSQILDKVAHSRQSIHQQFQEGKVVSIEQLRFMDRQQANSAHLISGLDPEIEQARKKMEEEKQKYDKLHQEKRAIEILREKALKEFKVQQERQEAHTLDEISKNFPPKF